jgi:hypothetical protein
METGTVSVDSRHGEGQPTRVDGGRVSVVSVDDDNASSLSELTTPPMRDVYNKSTNEIRKRRKHDGGRSRKKSRHSHVVWQKPPQYRTEYYRTVDNYKQEFTRWCATDRFHRDVDIVNKRNRKAIEQCEQSITANTSVDNSPRLQARNASIMKLIHDHEWYIENAQYSIEQEFWLQVPGSIIGANRTVDPDDINEKTGCFNVMYWHADQLKNCLVTKALMKRLLTDFGYKHSLFAAYSKEPIEIPKYFFRDIFESTTFHFLKQTRKGGWVVRDDKGLSVNVSENWIKFRSDIHHDVIASACNHARSGNYQVWTKIPAGRHPQPAKTGCMHGGLAKVAATAPMIQYRQTAKGSQCITYSFLSALHEYGCKKEAKLIHADMQGVVFDKHILGRLFGSITKHLASKKLEMLKGTKSVDCCMLDIPPESPVLIELLAGPKRCINHCVTIFGNQIYEASYRHAIPLTIASLQEVCGVAGFSGFGKWWVLGSTK